jgi:hypothetical protein
LVGAARALVEGNDAVSGADDEEEDDEDDEEDEGDDDEGAAEREGIAEADDFLLTEADAVDFGLADEDGPAASGATVCTLCDDDASAAADPEV